MNEAHFRTLDLNLLRVFVALYEEGSATRAGDRLGLTQSAVSHALNRLRYGLGDELFVRGPGRMTPTPRAAEIAPGVRQGLARLADALSPLTFDPASTDRRFVVAIGTYASSVLMPHVSARVSELAPRASVRLRSPDPPVVEALDAGRCDLLVTVFGRTPERFDSEPLFRDRLVWAMRASHPARRERLDLEQLAELTHVAVAQGETPDAPGGRLIDHGLERRIVLEDNVVEHLTARGLERRVGLFTSDLHSALTVVAETDMITPIPWGMFRRLRHSMDLAAFDPPYPSPWREVCALWRKDRDNAALQWLRSLMREAGARFMRENAPG